MKVQAMTPGQEVAPTTDQIATAIKMVLQAQQPQGMQMTPPNAQPNQPYNVIYNGVQNRGRGGPRNVGRNPGVSQKPIDKCFVCQGIGHWRRDCPYAVQRPNIPPPPQNRQRMRTYNQQPLFQQPQQIMPTYVGPVGAPQIVSIPPPPPVQYERPVNVGSICPGEDTHGCFSEYVDC